MKRLLITFAICYGLCGFFPAFAQGGCTANFVYGTDHCPNIYFYDNSTADTAILCWMFDYQGQGAVDFCENAHNKYSANGKYEVCLSIMTADGCTDTWCDSITIDCICEKPTAAFSALNNADTVSFSENCTSAYGLQTFAWDFGDGNSSSLPNPTHVYASGGNFQVCLAITDSCENDQRCEWVQVTGPLTSMAASIQSKIEIFPNPAQGMLFIRSQPGHGLPSPFRLVSLASRKEIPLPEFQQTGPGQIRMPLQTLAPGAYLLQFKCSGGTIQNEKILVY